MSVRSGQAFAILLALSVLAALVVALSSGSQLRYADEVDYFNLARHIHAGDGYVLDDMTPTAYRPPGYPFLMSLLAGESQGVLWLKLMNVVFLAAALTLIWRLAALHTPQSAWLAGAGALAYPVWLYSASTLYPQTVCMLLLLAVVWLLAHAKGRLGVYALAGLLLGCLVLTSPSFLLLTPVFGLHVLWLGGHGWRRNLLAATVLALVTAAVLAPWVARNHEVFGRFVPVATNGGVNLLLGNSEHAGPNTGVNVDVSRYTSQVQGLDEVATSQAYQRFAIEWVAEHPAQAMQLYWRKVLNYFNFRAEPRTTQEHAAWKDWLMAATYYPMLLLALIRVCLWKRYPLSSIEKLLLGLYVANVFLAAIFFTRVRFRLPMDGLLMTLAIIGAGHLHAIRLTRP